MTPVFVSLISGKLICLQDTIQALEEFCAGFHIDVMDGHFVNNLTWGPDIANAIGKASNKPLQIHLMVEYPEKIIPRLTTKADDVITVHYESKSTYNIPQLLNVITQHGARAGLAISPETEVKTLFANNHDMTQIAHITLMGVHPGFSGQLMLPATPARLRQLIQLRKEHDLQFIIALDGGVTLAQKKELIDAGADELVAASAIFNSQDMLNTLKQLSE